MSYTKAETMQPVAEKQLNPAFLCAGTDEKVFQVQRESSSIHYRDVSSHNSFPNRLGSTAIVVISLPAKFLEKHDVLVLENVKAVG